MTCVSAERITPVVGFIRPNTSVLGSALPTSFIKDKRQDLLPLGHSGPKGSTQVGWEQMDAPLERGNWTILAPSPVRWSSNNAMPKVMTREDMDTVRDQFMRCAEYASNGLRHA